MKQFELCKFFVCWSFKISLNKVEKRNKFSSTNVTITSTNRRRSIRYNVRIEFTCCRVTLKTLNAFCLYFYSPNLEYSYHIYAKRHTQMFTYLLNTTIIWAIVISNMNPRASDQTRTFYMNVYLVNLSVYCHYIYIYQCIIFCFCFIQTHTLYIFSWQSIENVYTYAQERAEFYWNQT